MRTFAKIAARFFLVIAGVACGLATACDPGRQGPPPLPPEPVRAPPLGVRLPDASAPDPDAAQPPAANADATSAPRANATGDVDERTGLPFARTLRVEIPKTNLGEFEPWQDRSAAHPRGTVIALGYTAYPGDGTSLVEIDVATGALVGQRDLEMAGDRTLFLTRTGDVLHVGAQLPKSFVWITYDRSLSETRRVNIPGMSNDALREDVDGFGVENDQAVLVSHAVQAYVFDAKGHRLAHHDCRPFQLVGFMRAGVHYANGFALILGLSGAGEVFGPALCAFRPDGQGPTLKASFKLGDSFASADRVLYLSTDDQKSFRKLGPNFRPMGPAVPDPRAAEPSRRCKVTGEYEQEARWVWNVEVVVTGECCGGERGGFFLCFPPESQTPPAPGARVSDGPAPAPLAP